MKRVIVITFVLLVICVGHAYALNITVNGNRD